MPRAKNNSDKQKALQQHGTLNPRRRMCAILCSRTANSSIQRLAAGEYEMLRQAHAEKRAFLDGQGIWFFPPVVFTKRIVAFEARWFARITSQKRGPRNGHKLTPEVMKFRHEQQTLEPSLSLAQLAEQVQHNFHVKVHPAASSAASAGKKSGEFVARSHCRTAEKDDLIAAYEELRRQILTGQRGPGLALFMRRGMREWMNACSLCLAPSPTRELLRT